MLIKKKKKGGEVGKKKEKKMGIHDQLYSLFLNDLEY